MNSITSYSFTMVNSGILAADNPSSRWVSDEVTANNYIEFTGFTTNGQPAQIYCELVCPLFGVQTCY